MKIYLKLRIQKYLKDNKHVFMLVLKNNLSYINSLYLTSPFP